MKKLSHSEMLAVPAKLLLDPTTGRAAAYNNSHRTITIDASSELIAYAQQKGYKDEPYDPKRQDTTGMWCPLPPWTTPEMLPRLRVISVRSGQETAAELRAIPLR